MPAPDGIIDQSTRLRTLSILSALPLTTLEHGGCVGIEY